VKQAIALCAVVLSGAATGADTYRWTDERGVVNYGERPPAGRSAKTVNIQPPVVVETPVKPSEAAQHPTVIPVPVATQPIAAVPAIPPVRGLDFQTFTRLYRGMSEGELMLRAGRPDFDSVENFRHDIVRSYYYYPTPSDPFITVISVRGGQIVHIERTRKMY
jgi:hypothetical protein